jgi:MtN3 and saliva related transmembrane protein
MSAAAIEAVGTLAALCTTLCWLPQAAKVIREKRTEGLSLATQLLFSLGLSIWCVYGLLRSSWPLVIANVVTLLLSLAILVVKLRYR